MTLLDFNPPKKVDIDAGFDGGPIGGYMPQMSQDDARRWKAKKFNIGKENARIELRRSVGATQVTIFVALDGWDYAKKYEYRRPYNPNDDKYFYHDTRGMNVRISMNGSALLTFEEFSEINQIVEEAKDYLETHQAKASQ